MPLPSLHVFLSHGLESRPNSTKMQALQAVAEQFPGVMVKAVDHRSSKDPATRLLQMQAAMKKAGAVPERTILAGSSMGGWVCAQTSAQTPVLGCFMLAPAFALEHYPHSKPTIGAAFSQIIHGWQDEVVPVGPVLELAQQQRISTLVLDDGHRLANSMSRITDEFRCLLQLCLESHSAL